MVPFVRSRMSGTAEALVSMRDSFDLWDDAGLPAVGMGTTLPCARGTFGSCDPQ
jgi:hypothetical protein